MEAEHSFIFTSLHGNSDTGSSWPRKSLKGRFFMHTACFKIPTRRLDKLAIRHWYKQRRELGGRGRGCVRRKLALRCCYEHTYIKHNQGFPVSQQVFCQLHLCICSDNTAFTDEGTGVCVSHMTFTDVNV